MSIRNSLVAFGISASVIVGSGAALNEAIDLKNTHAEQIACLARKYAGSTACKNSVITPEIAHSTHGTQLIYSWIAGLGLVGGAIGLAGAYGSTMPAGQRN